MPHLLCVASLPSFQPLWWYLPAPMPCARIGTSPRTAREIMGSDLNEGIEMEGMDGTSSGRVLCLGEKAEGTWIISHNSCWGTQRVLEMHKRSSTLKLQISSTRVRLRHPGM